MAIAAAVALTCLQRAAGAHCDTMDGPVVAAGQKALDTGDLKHALVWVLPDAEPELRALFKKVVKAKKKGTSPEVIEVLERYFLETLVRLHRLGEGEPYTGIREAGAEIDPGLAAADAAVADGSVADLTKALRDELGRGLRARFGAVQEHRDWRSVAEGRAFVHAYVEYIHYVAKVHAAIAGETVEH
jgi:hypothetical protein